MSTALFDLTGRTALVTGSARGIGLRLAEGLAAAMVPLIRDPSCYDAVSALARTWIAEHHSAERSLEVQLLAYSKILAGG